MNKPWVAFAASALIMSGAAQASTELVQNGTFNTDYAGWSLTGDTSYTGVASGQVYFGAVKSDAYFSQLLSTGSTGEFTISFDLAATGLGNTHFSMSFGGQTLYSTANTQFGFTHFIFTGTGTGATTELLFTGFNPQSWYFLDNVSVTAVPEPENYALFLAGLAMIGAMARRRRQA